MSFMEFLKMGGYGVYIWTSYAFATIAFVGTLAWLWRQKRQLLAGKGEE